MLGTMKIFVSTWLLLFLMLDLQATSFVRAVVMYGYKCIGKKCMRVEINAYNLSETPNLRACRLLCGDDNKINTLWPVPTGRVTAKKSLIQLNLKDIQLKIPEASDKKIDNLWIGVRQRFSCLIEGMRGSQAVFRGSGSPLRVRFHLPLTINDVMPKLNLDADESYKLDVYTHKAVVVAEISAQSFFGARHALDTLHQLIVYDDIQNKIFIVANASISDAPVYKWRGIFLDTSMNYLNVESIKRTIEAMSLVKMNTLQWRIVGTYSFPMELKSRPELYELGAYASEQIYTQSAIREIIEYARIRGIRIIPKIGVIDGFAAGWQRTNAILCFNKKPLEQYCPIPPCGQLDPRNNNTYAILEDIFREVFKLFDTGFAAIGSGVHVKHCWTQYEDIHITFAEFLKTCVERIDRAVDTTNEKTSVLIWDPHDMRNYDTERYIVQISEFNDDLIFKKGYRTIISYRDPWFLHCGVGAVLASDECSSYRDWKAVYDFDLTSVAGQYVSTTIGGEAVIFTGKVNDASLDALAWPRASCVAERLWSNPKSNAKANEIRMYLHREYLVEHGVKADVLAAQYCVENEGICKT